MADKENQHITPQRPPRDVTATSTVKATAEMSKDNTLRDGAQQLGEEGRIPKRRLSQEPDSSVAKSPRLKETDKPYRRPDPSSDDSDDESTITANDGYSDLKAAIEDVRKECKSTRELVDYMVNLMKDADNGQGDTFMLRLYRDVANLNRVVTPLMDGKEKDSFFIQLRDWNSNSTSLTSQCKTIKECMLRYITQWKAEIQKCDIARIKPLLDIVQPTATAITRVDGYLTELSYAGSTSARIAFPPPSLRASSQDGDILPDYFLVTYSRPDEDPITASNNDENFDVKCVFCERNTHISMDCYTVANAGLRRKQAEDKKICLYCAEFIPEYDSDHSEHCGMKGNICEGCKDMPSDYPKLHNIAFCYFAYPCNDAHKRPPKQVTITKAPQLTKPRTTTKPQAPKPKKNHQ